MVLTSRQRLHVFLVTKEVFMLTCVAISIGLLILEHTEQLSPLQLRYVDIFEVGVSILFLCEFLFELHFAQDRGRYMRHNWYYLLAAVPIPAQTFEALHGIRALRLLKLFKAFSHMRYERNTRLFR
jgi:hypothetical protein